MTTEIPVTTEPRREYAATEAERTLTADEAWRCMRDAHVQVDSVLDDLHTYLGGTR